MQDTDENKTAFITLIGHPVKVVIQDIDRPHFIRGVLKQVTNDFLYIEGDYSHQVIPIKTVLKITQVTNDQAPQFGNERERKNTRR